MMMAIEGPGLSYVRVDDADTNTNLGRALVLAREIEGLLDDPAAGQTGQTGREASAGPPPSSRMARAMAASLAGELEAVVRGARGARANGSA